MSKISKFLTDTACKLHRSSGCSDIGSLWEFVWRKLFGKWQRLRLQTSLTVLFIALKLVGAIDWSWGWILVPL